MTTTPSSQQVNALAFLMHSLRPDWDTPGCVAALRACPPLPLDQLGIAALKAATDPANETPAALAYLNNRAWDSDWYQPCRTHPSTRARRTNGECAACAADRLADESPTPRDRGGRPIPAEARALMLDALRPQPEETADA